MKNLFNNGEVFYFCEFKYKMEEINTKNKEPKER